MRYNECRFCNEPIYDSVGRVYCTDTCKALFKKIKTKVNEQNNNYWTIMNIKCKTCKKKLVNGESNYCSICIARRDAEKKRAAETDWYRPCKMCKEPMKNPAPNRKWCPECALERALTASKKRDIERKKERDVLRKERGQKKVKTTIGKGAINPYFLKPIGSKRRVG